MRFSFSVSLTFYRLSTKLSSEQPMLRSPCDELVQFGPSTRLIVTLRRNGVLPIPINTLPRPACQTGLTQASVGHEEVEPFQGGIAVGFGAAAEEDAAVEGVAELGFAEKGEGFALVVSGWGWVVIAGCYTGQLSSCGGIVNWELFTLGKSRGWSALPFT